jgi:uncharacterized FAD-dependent dehydrogenase
MPKIISLQLSPRQAADPKTYVPIAARLAGVSDTQVALARVVKRSVDARKGSGGADFSGRAPKVNLSVELYIDDERQPDPVRFDYPFVGGRTPVVIVGGGPAGLFCALRLIEQGLRPIVLERGKEVTERGKDIARINRGLGVDPDSNYAFGEGGAGTFSDGKLFTRSKKRGDYDRALQTLVHHGASEEILYEAHPHIGTDRLPRIMTAIRQTIRHSGGEVVFRARVTDIEIRGGRAVGVRIAAAGAAAGAEAGAAAEAGAVAEAGTAAESAAASGGGTLIESAAVVLATGHSARDIYEILHRRGVALEAKPFAMGVRIEHPQQLIDQIQYHTPDGRGEWLPAAAYSLVSQEGGVNSGARGNATSGGRRVSGGKTGGDRPASSGKAGDRPISGDRTASSGKAGGRPGGGSGSVGGRGVWSFCMCPGGFIVPAMTADDESVVNGMSPSLRNSPYANSGIVTEVRLADFEFLRAEFGPLAGLEFQRRLERAARIEAGGISELASIHGISELAGAGGISERAARMHAGGTGGAKAPAQRVADFVSARPSKNLPATSYVPGIVPSRLDEWLPGFMSRALRAGISTFGRRMHGFVTNEAIVVGVESRTSTPVRIPRHPDTLQHPAVEGLYPAGEGAGYAGGIVSAALDGERIAEAIKAAIG